MHARKARHVPRSIRREPGRETAMVQRAADLLLQRTSLPWEPIKLAPV